MTVRYVNDPLFGANYILAFNIKNGNLQPLSKRLSKRYGVKIELQNMPPEAGGFCQAIQLKEGLVIVISLEKFKNNPESKGFLAHECFHATEYVLEERDIKYCKETSEVWAYHIQMLVEKLSESCFKRRLPIKKKDIKKMMNFYARSR